LLHAGHEVALVLTRADQPAGRGQKLQASPVKKRALQAGLPVLQPRTLRDAQVQRQLIDIDADVIIVAAYGLILPREVLGAARYGCINIHASLLPRWRGAAPIQRAIEAGDRTTGITIMQMDEGLDTGPMLSARALPIGPEESAASLHDRLAGLGAAMIVEALDALQAGALSPVAQPAEGVTYAAKISKAETLLDWSLPAERLADKVRAFDPFPGTQLRLERVAEPVKLWRARALSQPVPGVQPGTVLQAGDDGLLVACGQGALSLLELQKPGGRRLALAEFLRGFSIHAGERFLLPADLAIAGSPG
jgi:methionyl-tRNA formyltransferase